MSYAVLVASTSWKEFYLAHCFKVTFFAVFDVSFNKFSLISSLLDCCVYEYVGVEFLFLFGESSANILNIFLSTAVQKHSYLIECVFNIIFNIVVNTVKYGFHVFKVVKIRLLLLYSAHEEYNS